MNTSSFETFGCWFGVQEFAREHPYIYYRAPLDSRPVPCAIVKLFKNGKIRLAYHDVSFTIDRAHLDRLFWRS